MGKFCHMDTFRAPPENKVKINKYRLSNIELVLPHIVSKLNVLGIARKLLVPSITFYPKNIKKLKFTPEGLPKSQLIIIWLIGILGINPYIKVPLLKLNFH